MTSIRCSAPLELILGMQPLGLNDALATPMYDAFISGNRAAQQRAVHRADPELCPEPHRTPPGARWLSLSRRLPFSRLDAVPQAISDQILWASVHGAKSKPPAAGPDASPDEIDRAMVVNQMLRADPNVFVTDTGRAARTSVAAAPGRWPGARSPGHAGPPHRVTAEPHPEAPAPAVAIAGLSKRYGERLALDDVSLQVAPGQLRGLLGPNGAGKTTLLRVLMRLIRPDAGTVTMLGRSLGGADARPDRGVAGFVEEPAFYPYLSGPREPRAAGRARRRSRPAGLRGARARRSRRARRPTAWPGTRPACDSDWGSPLRCCARRGCCCWTSRPAGWTREGRKRSAGCCESYARTA